MIARFRVSFIAAHSTGPLNVCQECLPPPHHMKPLHNSLPTTELHVHRSIPPFTHLCALTLGLNTSKHLTHCSPVVVGTFVPALRSRSVNHAVSSVQSANVVPASWEARSLVSRSTAAHTHCHRIRCSATRRLVVTTCKQTY